jgi:hypothetical protein
MYAPMDQCAGKVPPRMANPEPTRGSLVGPAHQQVRIQATVHKYPTILPSVVPSGHPSTGATRTTVSSTYIPKRLPHEEIPVPSISSP